MVVGGRWLFLAVIIPLALRKGLGDRAYPQGCGTKDPSYYDYEQSNLTFPSSLTLDPDDYRLTRRIGSGKFSDVFEAIGSDGNYVVIKCLKPVSERKIRREVLVLQRCRHVANLARLVGIVIHKETKNHQHMMPSLVLQHAGRDSEWLCHGEKATPLSDYEIRYYLAHLLVALDGLHSVGILHRDVKPRNVLINRQPSAPQPLMLIDLGLADFFLPATPYNVRVASRNYKSPELLTGLEYYDYSIDLWGVGCILAGLLLHREPFFRGRNNPDQLMKIVQVLGINDLWAFLHKYNVPLSAELQEELQKYDNDNTRERQPFVGASADGLDLLNHLLVYDPDERYTAQQALQHSYFDLVRERVIREVRYRPSR